MEWVDFLRRVGVRPHASDVEKGRLFESLSDPWIDANPLLTKAVP